MRFAVTSTEAQLRAAGELAAAHPDCHVHSHLSETEDELALVRRLFPWAADYTDVYDRFGLLGPRSVFAHGVHLSERECTRLQESESVVVHCPTANTFLGSGLFDGGRLARAERPVRIGIGTDVGGGTSYSMLATLGEAYKVAMLTGRMPTAHDLFHLATRGNAMRLGLDDEIGTLEAGRWADLVVLDPAATPVLADRHALSEGIEDTLFALAILGRRPRGARHLRRRPPRLGRRGCKQPLSEMRPSLPLRASKALADADVSPARHARGERARYGSRAPTAWQSRGRGSPAPPPIHARSQRAQ